MNINLEIIKKELLNNEISSSIIDEEWGVGKTYELLKIKDQLEHDNEYKNWSVVYLKIADLKNISIREHCCLHSNPNMKKLNPIKDILNKSKGNTVTVSSHLLNSLYEKNIKCHSLDNYLIIIDEIERIPNEIDIKEIFNQIFDIKESVNNVKLIISLCSEEFDNKNKITFKKWKNKVAEKDLKISFSGLSFLCDKIDFAILEKTRINNFNSKKIFEKYNIKNIREIKIFLNIFSKLINNIVIPENFLIDNNGIYSFFHDKLRVHFNLKRENQKYSLLKHKFFKEEITFDLNKISKLCAIYDSNKSNEVVEYIDKIKKEIIYYSVKNEVFVNFLWMHSYNKNDDYFYYMSNLVDVHDIKDKVSSVYKGVKELNSLTELRRYPIFFDASFLTEITRNNLSLYIRKVGKLKNEKMNIKLINNFIYKSNAYFQEDLSSSNSFDKEIFETGWFDIPEYEILSQNLDMYRKTALKSLSKFELFKLELLEENLNFSILIYFIKNLQILFKNDEDIVNYIAEKLVLLFIKKSSLITKAKEIIEKCDEKREPIDNMDFIFEDNDEDFFNYQPWSSSDPSDNRDFDGTECLVDGFDVDKYLSYTKILKESILRAIKHYQLHALNELKNNPFDSFILKNENNDYH